MPFLPNRRQKPSDPAVKHASNSSTGRLHKKPAQYAATLPPVYQAYDNSLAQRPFSPTTTYSDPYRVQHSFVALNAQGYGGNQTAWASASTIDMARPHTSEARAYDPAWSAQTPRPASSGNNDCGMARRMNQGAALCDRLAARLNEMMSRDEGEPVDVGEVENLARGLDLEEERQEAEARQTVPSTSVREQTPALSTGGSLINFRKTWLYQNSRLPPGKLPFVAYLPTWILACRAAHASYEVYQRPRRDEPGSVAGGTYYTDADPKLGTKATILTSQTLDDRRLLIVAIRGSQRNLVDWHINFGFAPSSPTGFLDDPGNACHAGFLQVARAMLQPVAAQLRAHIENNPAWAGGCSLLFTGHSAGGAVASLLFAHMLSRTVTSELTALAGVFRRVHCVTFGTPPISLLPLQLPRGGRETKNQFLSFANEGDLVVRADWAYLKSLARLLAAPAPTPPSSSSSRQRLREKVSRRHLHADAAANSGAARWAVPDASLSAAGRMVLLREKPHAKSGAVEAVQVTDGELRGVVFGDPAMHRMLLYKQRIDDLTFAVVSGREAG
ncbi:hypothetical protein LTR53_002332 [Teratosphaeriaceae sp. CCFEE 6253]|nr:hypothetical protein LTR53_002332 [Teratosphaeriaceae sp. CCFEE 6253]